MVNNINFKVDCFKFFASIEEIEISLSKGICTFYLPRKWNQKSIDELLALFKVNALYIAPIQITFDKEKHSDSKDTFFSETWPELNLRIPANLKKEVIFI
jgi:hypothetical protein